MSGPIVVSDAWVQSRFAWVQSRLEAQDAEITKLRAEVDRLAARVIIAERLARIGRGPEGTA